MDIEPSSSIDGGGAGAVGHGPEEEEEPTDVLRTPDSRRGSVPPCSPVQNTSTRDMSLALIRPEDIKKSPQLHEESKIVQQPALKEKIKDEGEAGGKREDKGSTVKAVPAAAEEEGEIEDDEQPGRNPASRWEQNPRSLNVLKKMRFTSRISGAKEMESPRFFPPSRSLLSSETTHRNDEGPKKDRKRPHVEEEDEKEYERERRNSPPPVSAKREPNPATLKQRAEQLIAIGECQSHFIGDREILDLVCQALQVEQEQKKLMAGRALQIEEMKKMAAQAKADLEVLVNELPPHMQSVFHITENSITLAPAMLNRPQTNPAESENIHGGGGRPIPTGFPPTQRPEMFPPGLPPFPFSGMCPPQMLSNGMPLFPPPGMSMPPPDYNVPPPNMMVPPPPIVRANPLVPPPVVVLPPAAAPPLQPAKGPVDTENTVLTNAPIPTSQQGTATAVPPPHSSTPEAASAPEQDQPPTAVHMQPPGVVNSESQTFSTNAVATWTAPAIGANPGQRSVATPPSLLAPDMSQPPPSVATYAQPPPINFMNPPPDFSIPPPNIGMMTVPPPKIAPSNLSASVSNQGPSGVVEKNHGSPAPPINSSQPPPMTSSQPPPMTSSQPPPMTSSQPPPISSSQATPMNSSQPPPMTSSQPPPMNSSQPPPMNSSQPPPLTSSQPPPVTSSHPPTMTSSQPPPMTSSQPPPMTASQPPPAARVASPQHISSVPLSITPQPPPVAPNFSVPPPMIPVPNPVSTAQPLPSSQATLTSVPPPPLFSTAVPPPSVAAPHVMGNGGSSVSVTTPVALTLTVPSVPPPHISMTVAPPPIAGSLPDLSVPPPNFSLPPPAVPPPQQANPKAPYQTSVLAAFSRPPPIPGLMSLQSSITPPLADLSRTLTNMIASSVKNYQASSGSSTSTQSSANMTGTTVRMSIGTPSSSLQPYAGGDAAGMKRGFRSSGGGQESSGRSPGMSRSPGDLEQDMLPEWMQQGGVLFPQPVLLPLSGRNGRVLVPVSALPQPIGTPFFPLGSLVGMNGTEGPPQMRKLFVGGLNKETSDEKLRTYFSKYGPVVDSIVICHPNTKTSRGFGFITFGTLAATESALENRPHKIDGWVVDTKRAIPREQMMPFITPPLFDFESQPGCKLSITGIHCDFHSVEALRLHFEKFGTLEQVEILGKPRGVGFVIFESREGADRALAHRGGKHVVNERRIDVRHAAAASMVGGPHPLMQAYGPVCVPAPPYEEDSTSYDNTTEDERQVYDESEHESNSSNSGQDGEDARRKNSS